MNNQDIEEVWFRGCHSDIGGGDKEAHTARIALRWMLGEAADSGLRLNAEGVCLLQPSVQRECAEVHESHTRLWRLIEFLPRKTIDNSGQWPTRIVPTTRYAQRHPVELMRHHEMTVHESVGPLCGEPKVRVVRTKTVDSTRASK